MKVDRFIKDYEDMLLMPHYVSNKRPRMAISNRAAQFSPFAAVVGHEEAIREKARYTEKKRELDETEMALIDEMLGKIEAMMSEEYPEVLVEYFEQDRTKSGGQYLTKVGTIKKLDSYEHALRFNDETVIDFGDIYRIELTGR